MRVWRVPYPKFGRGPGFARVSAIAERLGLALASFGVHGAAVVGSNGKGSTAAMASALLAQTGAAVGLFTSPHLLRLNERFRINGEDIGDEELDHHWRRVAGAAEDADLASQIGAFEFVFLIAADWFAARGCVHTVWEAGIGGRHDPVRLIEAKRLALTALDLEHTELLGDTLSEIASDKLDAAPRGATLFADAECVVRDAVASRCAERGVRLALVDASMLGDITLPLTGAHQRGNAALALHLARDIAPLSPEAVLAGFAAARWPARLETIETDPLVVIDVGHTPLAIAAALQGFNALRGSRVGVLVCGASMDKRANEMIAALAPEFATIICTAARHKGAPPAEIARYASAVNPNAEIAVVEAVAQARAFANTKARALGAAVYVAGGLFLAAEYKAAALGRDPASLVFL
jgi:dihydrofolate synthase/folylpolyglutamate synthase